MPLAALILTLIAASLHAAYNFLIKSSRDAFAFMWWSVTIGCAVYGAWLLTTTGIFLAAASVPFYFISVVAEIGFFVTIVRGYDAGDLSLVYPLSRGAPPILVAVWGLFFLNERLPAFGYVGIGLVVIGIFVASLTANGAHNWRDSLRHPATLWALASAFFIAIYSQSDKFVLSNGTPSLVYNFWVFAGNAVGWLPIVWTRARVAQNFALVREQFARLLFGAIIIVSVYALILTALALTSASYITAGRSSSVIISALLGTLVLKESFGRARLIGATMMVCGIALMAIT
ncbi:MAG: EamA family transporter [Chloroflexi bacterium]|nr:EamA family transporter [Chloroflexota bacterium]